MHPLLCLGTRDSLESVRSIKYGETLYVFPPYSSKIKWSEDNDNNIIIVSYGDKKITIDKTNTIDTYRQCWGIKTSSLNISDDDFFSNVIRLFDGNNGYFNLNIDQNEKDQLKNNSQYVNGQYVNSQYVNGQYMTIVIIILILIGVFALGFYIGNVKRF